MEEKYIFKVSSREIKSYSQEFEVNIVISISKAPSMYLFVKLNKSEDCIYVDSISFKADKYQRFDGYTIGYLKGLFGFLEAEDINRALLDLEKVLNDKQPSISIYIEEWQYFAGQFKKWFEKKLKPCLEKELELYKMYYIRDAVEK
jgi:hypothetical protein